MGKASILQSYTNRKKTLSLTPRIKALFRLYPLLGAAVFFLEERAQLLTGLLHNYFPRFAPGAGRRRPAFLEIRYALRAMVRYRICGNPHRGSSKYIPRCKPGDGKRFSRRATSVLCLQKTTVIYVDSNCAIFPIRFRNKVVPEKKMQLLKG